MAIYGKAIRRLRLSFECLEFRRLCIGGNGFIPPPIDNLGQLDPFVGVGKQVDVAGNPATGEQSGCTATLLPTGRHAITAAHCLIDVPLNSTFFIAFNTQANPFYEEFAVTKNSSNVFQPEQNPSVTGGKDLAIINLNGAQNAANLDGLTRHDVFREFGADLNTEFIQVGIGQSHDGTNFPGFPIYVPGGRKRMGRNEFEATGNQMSNTGPGTPLNPQDGFIDGTRFSTEPNTLLFDFDHVDPEFDHDAFAQYLGPSYSDPVGLGIDEIVALGGDSGSPSLIGCTSSFSKCKIGGILNADLRPRVTG
jgi:hypothetical protein